MSAATVVPTFRTDTLLSVEDVCLSFGDKPVLSNVSVKVDNLTRAGDGANGQTTGQVVAFLGPSGVGKTMLLRILAGLQKPTSGNVYITKDRKPIHAGLVGLVSQNYLLYRHRTVMGNLRTAAMRRSCNGYTALQSILTYFKRRADAEDEAKKLLERFDDESKTLTSRMNLYPSQFSGGQRQRIAIAQQLLCSEHFLLMDEPTAGLDPLMKRKVCSLITEVANQDDLNTIIVVTHDIRSALSFADTVWVMGRDRDAQGRIVSGAKIKKVYDLVERGLTWNRDAMNEPEFIETEKEILTTFDTL